MKKTSLGEIRTMADDLMVADGKQPQVDASEMPKKEVPAQDASMPKMPAQNSSKPASAAPSSEDLKKLLPFEGEDVEDTEKSKATPPPPVPKTPEKPSTPPSLNDLPKASPPSPEKPLSTPKPPTPKPLTPKPAPAPAPKEETKKPPLPPIGKKIQPPPIKNKNNNKLWLFIAFGVLGAVIIGGVSYLLFFGGPEEEPEPPIDNEPVNGEDIQATPPDSFIEHEYEQEITVSDTTHAKLLNTINLLPDRAQELSLAPGSITYIPIRLKGVVEEGNRAKYIDAETLLNGLNIAYPENLFSTVESDAMLYMYQPTEEERIMCQNNLITETDCFGPRLSFIFKATEGNEPMLNDIKTSWESITPSSNLGYLTLNDLANTPGDIEFSSMEYQGYEVSYTNLPMPSYNNLKLSTTSIDMAVVGEYLVIGTSKNSTLKIIDKLLEKTN